MGAGAGCVPNDTIEEKIRPLLERVIHCLRDIRTQWRLASTKSKNVLTDSTNLYSLWHPAFLTRSIAADD